MGAAIMEENLVIPDDEFDGIPEFLLEPQAEPFALEDQEDPLEVESENVLQRGVEIVPHNTEELEDYEASSVNSNTSERETTESSETDEVESERVPQNTEELEAEDDAGSVKSNDSEEETTDSSETDESPEINESQNEPEIKNGEIEAEMNNSDKIEPVEEKAENTGVEAEGENLMIGYAVNESIGKRTLETVKETEELSDDETSEPAVKKAKIENEQTSTSTGRN